MPGTKGGHPSDDAQSRVWHPTLVTVLVDDVARPRRWLLGLNMSADCHQNYGAPSQVFVDINVTSSNFEATVTILDKTPTRLPEAAFITFNPKAAGNWANEILGISNNATDAVPHGSQHLHASEAVTWQGGGNGGGSLRVESLDAGLLCYGEANK